MDKRLIMKNRIVNIFSFETRPFIQIHKLFLIAIVYYVLINSLVVILSNFLQWIYDSLRIWEIIVIPIFEFYNIPIFTSDAPNVRFFTEILFTPFLYIGTLLVSIIPVIIIAWLFVEIMVLIMDEINILQENKSI